MKHKIILTDIQYDVNMNEILDYFDDCLQEKDISNLLNIYEHEWALLGENEKIDRINKAIDDGSLDIAELFRLPKTLIVPDHFYSLQEEGMTFMDAMLDDGVLADWISNETGYCVKTFWIESDYNREEIEKHIQQLKLSITPETWNIINEMVLLQNGLDVIDHFKEPDLEEEEERE